MILDLNAIKRSGKTEESFFFEYNADIDIALPDTELLSPVKVQGTAYLTGDNSADIEGEIVFTLKGACTRCLTDTEKVFSVDLTKFSEKTDIP